jgi:hypothetical protein
MIVSCFKLQSVPSPDADRPLRATRDKPESEASGLTGSAAS